MFNNMFMIIPASYGLQWLLTSILPSPTRTKMGRRRCVFMVLESFLVSSPGPGEQYLPMGFTWNVCHCFAWYQSLGSRCQRVQRSSHVGSSVPLSEVPNSSHVPTVSLFHSPTSRLERSLIIDFLAL
jgi:hypothetical protein